MDVNVKNNLKFLSEDRGLTPTDLSRMTGLSPQQINGYIVRNSIPTTKSAILLARALGVSIDVLLGEDICTDHLEESSTEGVKVGQCITKLRIKNYYTVRELARKTGITQQALRDIERGIRTPPYSYLVQIAQALNVTTDFLLGVPSQVLNERIKVSKQARKVAFAFEHASLKDQVLVKYILKLALEEPE